MSSSSTATTLIRSRMLSPKRVRPKGQPTAIVMHTIKGKGVSFMENKASWHGTAPNDEQYAQAIQELRDTLSSLEAE